MTESNQKVVPATAINERFEQNINLCHLLADPVLKDLLTTVINQYQNDRADGANPASPVILLCGNSGRRTAAMALHNTCGNLCFKFGSGFFMETPQKVDQFFTSGELYTTFYLSDVELLSADCQRELLSIICSRKVAYDCDLPGLVPDKNIETDLIVLSASNKYSLSRHLLENVSAVVPTGVYSQAQIIEILEQRAKILGWSYRSMKVVVEIARQSGYDVHKAMYMLAMSYRVMRSGNASQITMEHVRKAKSFVRYQGEHAELEMQKMNKNNIEEII